MAQTLTDRLAAVRVPVICALNGSVYGGGAEIALCCDFRIGVRGSRLAVPAARLGVCYPLGGLTRYVQRLGLATAERLLVAVTVGLFSVRAGLVLFLLLFVGAAGARRARVIRDSGAHVALFGIRGGLHELRVPFRSARCPHQSLRSQLLARAHRHCPARVITPDAGATGNVKPNRR